MIVKQIKNKKTNGSKAARVAGVANYIVQPDRENGIEKCIHHEAENFLTDTHDGHVVEMIALAQDAVRSKDPIDHWILSWPPSERPSVDQVREAVHIFTAHCGLKGHQIIWGLHDDTQNMHVHIVINRVHPDTLKVVEINKGFQLNAAHQAIAIIEKKQGWKSLNNARYKTNEKGELLIDSKTKRPAIKTQDNPSRPPSSAQDMEIQTGEKSVIRICKERAAPIIKSAKSWAELHAALDVEGFKFERFGSGSIIYFGDVAVKSSSVDRAASITALQKHLGPYQPPHEKNPYEYHHIVHTTGSSNSALVVDQGVRRDTNAERDNQPKKLGGTGQPLKPNQPGWNEYIEIRNAQKAKKTKEKIALQTRHDNERAALTLKQKTERNDIFVGDWTGNGKAKNVLRSLVATQHAAEKLELSEKHKEERKALQSQYKPMPIYKDWQEQPQIVGLHVLPLIDQQATRKNQLTVVQTLRALTSHVDERNHVTYRIDRQDVFRDEGRIIAILDVNSDRGIAAALATAQQKFGQTLELTGSDEFKQRAVAMAVANNLTCRFSDPTLDQLREQLQQQKYQMEREEQRALQEQQRAEQAHAKATQAQEAAAAALALDAEREAAEQAEAKTAAAQVIQAQSLLLDPAPRVQQPDYLADIHAQIAVAKSAADPRSLFACSKTIDADPDVQDYGGVIVGCNDEFVAVQRGELVKLYQVSELSKRISYDGTDTGNGRFAPGNELARKNGKDGMRTLIIEERAHMQNEAERERRNDDFGLG